MTAAPTQRVTQVEPCRKCGAPLAADQRYCLNCGKRRGEPRLDFRQHQPPGGGAAVNGKAPQPTAATAPVTGGAVAPEQKPQRDYTPLAAAGGIAVLGLMLLVGVLIGRGDGDQAVAPAPQVVRVQGGGEEEATASNGGGALEGGEAGAKGSKSKGSGKKDGALTGAGAKAPPPEITASDSELENLESKSPQEYSEAAAKLPDEIATPGAAPPTDDKAPGGGSKGTAIE